MQKSQPTGAKPSFGLQDILYVLFKHKWKILACGALGLAAAVAVFLKTKPFYKSEGRLLISYVLQRGAIDDHETQMEAGGRSGEQVINTELEIMRSADLAAAVADSIGFERILGAAGGSRDDAAGAVAAGLEAKPISKGSNVVSISYQNHDPSLALEILRAVVKEYSNKHLEIHRSVGAFDSVAKQVKEVEKRLKTTEAELSKLKTDTGIISVADEATSLAAQRDRIMQELAMTEAELASQRARVEDLAKGVSDTGSSVPDAQGATAAPPRPGNEQLEAFTEVSERLKLLQKEDFELTAKYKDGNPLVIRNRQEIQRLKENRQRMIEGTPGLVAEASAAGGHEVLVDPLAILAQARTKLRELEARHKVYKDHSAEQEARFGRLSTTGLRILDLERRKDMDDAEYRLLDSKLKKAEVDRNLDLAGMPNIRVVQEPSAPVRAFGEMAKKIVLGLAAAGFVVGIGLAFLIELVIDRRIKRPNEIESRLQLPLMLSIPYVRPKNRGTLMISNERNGESATDGAASVLPAVRDANGFHAIPGRTDHFIHPYSEAIRDRIVFNFQINNMTHKPKMMAVTGLSAGAGTSTIAAGLAKAFSEINGAKVLLVDLNSAYPDDNPMFGNKPLHSLVGALQAARNTRFKEGSQNLYLASAAARKTDANTTAFGPMHLYELLPHFRASEFDYVIFDMPPMAQTSPTLAMAGLMDKVLLVVDGEDTSRDTLKWGYSELVKGRADVSCVFNKARSHAPRWVAGEA
jgi:succinoglycan biosynthesis transport protein ExoP